MTAAELVLSRAFMSTPLIVTQVSDSNIKHVSQLPCEYLPP